MRVLVVSNYALPHVGGIQTLVDQELRALAAAGHCVVLVTSNAEGLTSVPVYPKEARVIRIPAWHVLERRFCIFYPLFSPHLLWVLWREVGRCDVIHIHGLLFLSSLAAVFVGWLRGRPRIVTEHLGNYHTQSRLAAWLAWCVMETAGRFTARLSTLLVAFSPAIVTLLNRLAGTSAKSVLLPKPLDPGFAPATAPARQATRARLGWQSLRPKVLFVGRLIPDKGVLVLLAAANQSFDLVFCGPGDTSLLGAMPRAGLEYLPPRSPAELADIYQAADVLVVPSIREGGLPLVVLEGLACGLRVVLSDYEGAEPYRDFPGIVFCDRNPDAIRRAILTGIEKPSSVTGEEVGRGLARVTTSPEEWVHTLYEPFLKEAEAAGLDPALTGATSRECCH